MRVRERKSQNLTGLNKVGSGERTGRHLDFRIFNLSVSASRKDENQTDQPDQPMSESDLMSLRGKRLLHNCPAKSLSQV